jgi:hypothetical protein
MKSQPTYRPAFTVTEMVVALALFTVATVAIAQLAMFTKAGSRVLWEQQAAGETLANVAEEVNVLPWEELTEERLAKLQLDEATQKMLPEAKVWAKVSDLEGTPLGKLIELELTRDERTLGRLSVWRFQAEAAP